MKKENARRLFRAMPSNDRRGHAFANKQQSHFWTEIDVSVAVTKTGEQQGQQGQQEQQERLLARTYSSTVRTNQLNRQKHPNNPSSQSHHVLELQSVVVGSNGTGVSKLTIPS